MRLSPLARRPRPDQVAGVGGWLIIVATVLALAFQRGGFEQSVYSEVGIGAWWFVGIGIAAGAVSLPRDRSAWIAVALLGALAAWTAASLIWSDSAGRSAVEASRVIAYLGVFAAALLLAGGNRVRLVIGAVAAAIGLVGVVALLSRLEPGWFPENRLPDALLGTQSRLAYPVGYWNALAGLLAIGLPLLLWAVLSARLLVLRCIAASAVPTLVLAGYFTFSRAGVIAGAVALVALVALAERRLTLLAPLIPLVAAGAFLIWQGGDRDALAAGLETTRAAEQGEQMLFLTAVVSLLCGLAVGALGVAARRDRLSAPRTIRRRTAIRAGLAVAVLAAVSFVAIGGPGMASDRFEEFKDPTGLSETSTRLESFAGNGRWQYWTESVDAAATDPVLGIGPGTFEFWWARNRDIDTGLVRDAHSLYVETLGELGIVGLLLLVAVVGFILVMGGRRALAAAGERRLELAAATAAFLAFAVAAGLDWLWELAVVPVAALMVAATVLRAEPGEGDGDRRIPARAVSLLVALVAIAAIALPYRSAELIAESQGSARAGDLDGALSAAEEAIDLQPFAGQPRTQQALVLERSGELAGAAEAAREATEREPTNWEPWFVLARVQRQRGKLGPALVAFRRAQELYPNSQLLDPIRCDRNPERC